MAEQQGSRWHFRKNTVTFLICLIVSGIIWISITLSREYTQKNDFRVVCTDIPAPYQSAKISTGTFTLVFHARGFDFIKSGYTKKNQEIKLPLKKLLKNENLLTGEYTFSKFEMSDFLKENIFREDEFVEIETPENITVQLK